MGFGPWLPENKPPETQRHQKRQGILLCPTLSLSWLRLFSTWSSDRGRVVAALQKGAFEARVEEFDEIWRSWGEIRPHLQ